MPLYRRIHAYLEPRPTHGQRELVHADRALTPRRPRPVVRSGPEHSDTWTGRCSLPRMVISRPGTPKASPRSGRGAGEKRKAVAQGLKFHVGTDREGHAGLGEASKGLGRKGRKGFSGICPFCPADLPRPRPTLAPSLPAVRVATPDGGERAAYGRSVLAASSSARVLALCAVPSRSSNSSALSLPASMCSRNCSIAFSRSASAIRSLGE